MSSLISQPITLTSLELRLAQTRSRYDQGAGQLALLEGQWEERAAAHERVKSDLVRFNLTKALLTEVSDYARRQLVERIEATVTAGLRIILGRDDLSFRVAIRKVNEVSWADWQVVSLYGESGVEVANSPEESRGGGIVDILSLTLRLALLELSRPRPEGPVILDEPGKQISVQYARNLAAFLRSYIVKANRQCLLVTHNPILAAAADLGYWVEQTDGISHVARIGPEALRDFWVEIEDKSQSDVVYEDKSQAASEEVPQ